MAKADGRWLKLGASGIVGLAAVLVLWFVAPSMVAVGSLTVMTAWLLTSQLVLSADVVFASIRQMSLAHVALWGVGAYFMLGLQTHWAWSFWPAFGGAVLATVVVAAAMSVIVFRVSGYYFAILTFVVSQVINLCFTNLSITGGPSGLFAFSQASVLGLDVAKPVEMYRLSIVATVVVFVGVFLFRRSRLCRKANAVGENEPLARALGLRQQWIKRQVFVVSAIPVAISGALYATSVGAIQPGLFGPQVAIAVILMTLLGGSGSILGPLLGGAVYIVLPQALPLNPTVATGVVGILFILIIRVAPRGLWPAISEMAQWVVARLRGRARSRPPTTPPKRAPQATRPALAPSGEGSS